MYQTKSCLIKKLIVMVGLTASVAILHGTAAAEDKHQSVSMETPNQVTVHTKVSKNDTVHTTILVPPPPLPPNPQPVHPVEGGMVTYEHRF